MADTTIVIPCYNEAQRLDVDAFVRNALGDPSCRFLFVNDGSTDETLDVLRTLQEYDADRFAVLDLARNGGKAEAVRQGVLSGLERSPKYIGYWDADLATPLEAIQSFRDVLQRHDHLQIATGARVRMLGRRIDRKPMRHVLGRVFAAAASHTLGLAIYDTQCGAKLFRVTDATRELFLAPFVTNWIFDVEWMARLIRRQRLAGAAGAARLIYELPLDQWRDVHGSKVRPRDFVKAFHELLTIYWTYLRGLPRGVGEAEPVMQPAEEPRAVSTEDGPLRRTQNALPARQRGETPARLIRP